MSALCNVSLHVHICILSVAVLLHVRTCTLYLYTIYSGTPLLCGHSVWTPWGPGKVSCIERCPHFSGKFLLRKDTWDIAKCP